MSMPTIALCGSAQSMAYLIPHRSSQFCSSHGSSEQKPSIRLFSAGSQNPMLVGAQSSLSFRHRSATATSFSNVLGSTRKDRREQLGGFASYPSCSFSMKCHTGPCNGSDKISVKSSSRCPPPIINVRDWNTPRTGRERQFDGIIRNALGSCLDHSSSFPLIGSDGRLNTEELTFNLEETASKLGSSCEPDARKLLSGAQSRHMIFNDNFIVKAFYEAKKANTGQARLYGNPYLEHCVGTAELLAKIGANATVVAAGLLHDTVDDSFMTFEYIFREFGAGVADLVEGVSKISCLSKLAQENNIALGTVEADRLHTMFLAMTDARAVLIKLADRLHNMMILQALEKDKHKRQRLANETLVIFAPLANRLGILSWKVQLENLCFEHLHPEEYENLQSKLPRYFDEAMVASAIEKLKQTLKSEGVSYHVLSGRHKSLYSIYSKMLKNKQNMDEIYDIHGLRLIVEHEEDCYRALDIVHSLWSKVPGKSKDYILHPKANGYRSLHTVVLSEKMLFLEVQIRTREMHLQAEFGFAAHWRYKEGACQHSSFVFQLVESARRLLSCHCETTHENIYAFYGAEDFIRPPCLSPLRMDSCPGSDKHQYNDGGPVFIIALENDKMSVKEFPSNSTVMDLLEKLGGGSYQWHAYGFTVKEELRPRLNGEPISNPREKLKMGDIVELSPTIPDESLTECREEIKRMYIRGPTILSQNRCRS